MHHLISLSDLIRQSVDRFKQDWKPLAKMALWLLIPSLLSLPIQFLSAAKINGIQAFSALAGLVLWAVSIIFFILIPARVYQFILKRESGHGNQALPSWPWHYFGPILWIYILQILICLGIILASVLAGALVAFAIGSVTSIVWIRVLGISIVILVGILALIFISVRLSQSLLVLLDEDVHGTHALRRSWQLTAGRAWSVFVRLFIPGLLYLLFTLVITLAALLVLGLIGFAIVGTHLEGIKQAFASGSLSDIGLFVMVSLGVLVAIFFLFATFLDIATQSWPRIVQVKLFRSLKGGS